MLAILYSQSAIAGQSISGGLGRWQAEMNEPSISEQATDPSAQAYRVFFTEPLRTIGTVSVRIERNADGSATVVTHWLDKSRKHLHTIHRKLTAKQFQAFADFVEKTSFWQEQQKPLHPPLDNNSWLVEAVKAGRYHHLEVLSPDKKDPVYRIGQRMLELGNSPIEPK